MEARTALENQRTTAGPHLRVDMVGYPKIVVLLRHIRSGRGLYGGSYHRNLRLQDADRPTYWGQNGGEEFPLNLSIECVRRILFDYSAPLMLRNLHISSHSPRLCIEVLAPAPLVPTHELEQISLKQHSVEGYSYCWSLLDCTPDLQIVFLAS